MDARSTLCDRSTGEDANEGKELPFPGLVRTSDQKTKQIQASLSLLVPVVVQKAAAEARPKTAALRGC